MLAWQVPLAYVTRPCRVCNHHPVTDRDAVAVEALEQATSAYRAAQESLAARRGELVAAMVEATRAGVRQSRIVQITGYTREHIRQLVARSDDASDTSAPDD